MGRENADFPIGHLDKLDESAFGQIIQARINIHPRQLKRDGSFQAASRVVAGYMALIHQEAPRQLAGMGGLMGL
jgi:hypothetical protein